MAKNSRSKKSSSGSASPAKARRINVQANGHVKKVKITSETPRKVLHSSIGRYSVRAFTRVITSGFLVLYCYVTDFSTANIAKVLLIAFMIIFPTDLLRFSWPAFNKFYQSVLGFLMRESEKEEHFNGVIWYIVGCWTVLTFLPKDVASIAIVLLSWCDTAAALVGRRFGYLTPRFPNGKSLAGTMACMVVGGAVSFLFWNYVQPYTDQQHPHLIRDHPPSWTASSQHLDLVKLSALTGVVAGASELVGGLFGLDDNATLPVLCGFALHLLLNVAGLGK